MTLALLMLGGCQSSGHRRAELAQICADPGNRQTGSFYFDECAAYTHPSNRRLQRDYQLGAPEGPGEY